MTVSLNTTNSLVSRVAGKSAIVTFTRAGDLQSPLQVNYSLSGSAVAGQDFQLSPTYSGTTSLSIPAGATSANVEILPLTSTNFVQGRGLRFSVDAGTAYEVGTPATVDLTIGGNTIVASMKMSPQGAVLAWPSSSSKQYRIAYKNNLTDREWTPITQITATSATSSWIDPAAAANHRFYIVAQVN
jgi:hypothetical protein